MSARQCAPDCPKMAKRRKLYEEEVNTEKHSENKTFETDDDIATSTQISKSSHANLSINLSDLSHETEYLSVPLGDSSSKDVKEHLRKRVNYTDRMKKSYRKPQERSYRRPQTPRPRRVRMDNVELTDADELTSRYVSSSPRSLCQKKRYVQIKRSDRLCKNDECLERPKRVKSLHYIEVSSSSSDLSCPALCDFDEAKLPESKQRCESSCPSQIMEDKQREMDQAEIDRFVLYGGYRYFDDLCHCSLKCLLLQIFGDKFVQKTTYSVLFFVMGMKLCYELHHWYTPF